jgi:hypothetical protein
MNQPRLLRLALLLALAATAVASAQADGLLQAAGNVSRAAAGPHDGCTGTLRASPGAVAADTFGAHVIFHDGRHAPVDVPLEPIADSPVADSAGGGGSPMGLPGADSPKPHVGPRWQTFLPGSLK